MIKYDFYYFYNSSFKLEILKVSIKDEISCSFVQILNFVDFICLSFKLSSQFILGFRLKSVRIKNRPVSSNNRCSKYGNRFDNILTMSNYFKY